MKKRIKIDEQLTLRALVSADAIRMYQIIDSQRDYLGEWLPFVQFTNKLEDSKGFVEMCIQNWKNMKDFVFKICLDDRMVGLIGTKEIDYLNKSTEIGYWLSEEVQHQGIMAKAVKVLLENLFEEFNLQRIQICCATGNVKSSNIPLRLGFVKEGVKRNAEWVGNYEFRDLEVYSLLKGDFVC